MEPGRCPHRTHFWQNRLRAPSLVTTSAARRWVIHSLRASAQHVSGTWLQQPTATGKAPRARRQPRGQRGPAGSHANHLPGARNPGEAVAGVRQSRGKYEHFRQQRWERAPYAPQPLVLLPQSLQAGGAAGGEAPQRLARVPYPRGGRRRCRLCCLPLCPLFSTPHPRRPPHGRHLRAAPRLVCCECHLGKPCVGQRCACGAQGARQGAGAEAERDGPSDARGGDTPAPTGPTTDWSSRTGRFDPWERPAAVGRCGAQPVRPEVLSLGRSHQLVGSDVITGDGNRHIVAVLHSAARRVSHCCSRAGSAACM